MTAAAPRPDPIRFSVLCLLAGLVVTILLGMAHAILEDPVTALLLAPLTVFRDLAPAKAAIGVAYLALGTGVSTVLYGTLFAALLGCRRTGGPCRQ